LLHSTSSYPVYPLIFRLEITVHLHVRQRSSWRLDSDGRIYKKPLSSVPAEAGSPRGAVLSRTLGHQEWHVNERWLVASFVKNATLLLACTRSFAR
jgi:hypothetical protein